MDALHRISFYTQMSIQRLKKMLHPHKEKEIMSKLEAQAELVSPEDTKEIERTIREHEENEPVLNPEKTMLIFSRPEEHKCNVLTVESYRDKLHVAIEWARKNGVDTFLTDYSTPLGLLALEELLELREAEDISHRPGNAYRNGISCRTCRLHLPRNARVHCSLYFPPGRYPLHRERLMVFKRDDTFRSGETMGTYCRLMLKFVVFSKFRLYNVSIKQ